MREFGIFFETQLHERVEGCGEETKEEVEIDGNIEIEESTKNQKPISSVLEIMKDFTVNELSDILGINNSNEPIQPVETKSVPNKRGKGRKQAENSNNDESEENKVVDDPKRNAIETLKREINLMEADRDRYLITINFHFCSLTFLF